jgi:gluconolactonase
MHAGLESLVAPDAKPHLLASGYQVTEGPVWVRSERCLYFHDIPGDSRWRWTEEGGVELVARPTFKANGTCLDIDGNMVVCEQVSSRLVRLHPGAASETLAFHYKGRYLNSPNDVVTRSADGFLYFTDPDFGRWNDWIGQRRSRDSLGFRGLYRVSSGGGEPELIACEQEFDQPNGLCFSPDERLLYVNDSPRGHVKIFDVAADGSLSGGRILLEGIGGMVGPDGTVEVDARHRPAAPDGMECDELGNVWVTGPGGIWVISPEGRHLGVLDAPEVCKSLVWGGDGMRTLFLMTETTVHAVNTLVGPAPLPPDR